MESKNFQDVNFATGHPVRTERTSALANILKGYEDFTLDISGRIISSNLEAVNITGYEEWEAIGRNFSMFYTQQDKDNGVPKQDLEKAGKCSKITFSAWRMKKRNVSFWADVTFFCLKDDDGTITGFKMILKDQTHRLLSNSRVKRFRNEYLNLFNSPFIGVLKFKLSDFKLTLVNDRAAKLFGNNNRHKKFSDVFHDSMHLQNFLNLLHVKKKINGFEFRLNRRDETWVRIDCRKFEQEGFVEGIISDITESKLQVTQLERLNEELDNFIYHASHDLRSPLTTLMGLINLAEFDTHIGFKEYCKMMRERVTYLDELLKDMASIAFNGKMPLRAEPIRFDEFLSEIVDKQRHVHPKLSIHFESAPLVEFYTDKHRVQEIFRNLILNAVMYQNPLIEPSIHIKLFSEPDKVFIHVADNGRGIKEEHLPQLFGMFYKVSHEVKDTGLRLYATKLMVEKLKGQIHAKSKFGTGTTFEIELPSLKAISVTVNSRNFSQQAHGERISM